MRAFEPERHPECVGKVLLGVLRVSVVNPKQEDQMNVEIVDRGGFVVVGMKYRGRNRALSFRIYPIGLRYTAPLLATRKPQLSYRRSAPEMFSVSTPNAASVIP